jgi:23S rRNA pseudouridine1911/1915/1917 synthase
MDVLFCDNHLLVVNKPAGLPTQSEEGENLHELAKAWVKKTYDKPGKVFLEPIHRLDKPVSGIVLFARTSKALSRLQAMMRARQIKKTYFAWVEGTPPQAEALLKHYLVHDDFRARVVSPSTPQAKEALLTYRVLEKKTDKTLLEIDLQTGRYHQIRAQLSAIGCPVLGDEKYGSTRPSKPGIALHHGLLTCEHPVTHAPVTFTSKFS